MYIYIYSRYGLSDAFHGDFRTDFFRRGFSTRRTRSADIVAVVIEPVPDLEMSDVPIKFVEGITQHDFNHDFKRTRFGVLKERKKVFRNMPLPVLSSNCDLGVIKYTYYVIVVDSISDDEQRTSS